MLYVILKPKFHAELLPEFKEELEKYGRIYMYRFRPDYEMYARPISEYPKFFYRRNLSCS